MRLWRALLVTVLLTLVVGLGGCKKKKPAVPAPQAQAPTVAPAPQAAPVPQPARSEPNRPQPEAAPATATTAPSLPAAKPKPKRNHSAKKQTPPAPAPEKPSRVVVPEGGAKQPSGPQLSATLPPEEAIHQQLNTAQLLEATDYNLKSISRPLTADEQGTMQHIRTFMQQSREASKDGDVERAYRLAFKAHLLSDELVKPK
jgi:hypothetical protein